MDNTPERKKLFQLLKGLFPEVSDDDLHATITTCECNEARIHQWIERRLENPKDTDWSHIARKPRKKHDQQQQSQPAQAQIQQNSGKSSNAKTQSKDSDLNRPSETKVDRDQSGRGANSRGQKSRGRGRGRGSSSQRQISSTEFPQSEKQQIHRTEAVSHPSAWDTPLQGNHGVLPLPTPTADGGTPTTTTPAQASTTRADIPWTPEQVDIDWNTPSIPPSSLSEQKPKQGWSASSDWDAQNRPNKNAQAQKSWTPSTSEQPTAHHSNPVAVAQPPVRQPEQKSFFSENMMVWKSNEAASTPTSTPGTSQVTFLQQTKFSTTSSSDKSKAPVILPTHIEKISMEDSPVSFGSFQADPTKLNETLATTAGRPKEFSDPSWQSAQSSHPSSDRSPSSAASSSEPPKVASETRPAERPAGNQERERTTTSKSSSPNPIPTPSTSVSQSKSHHYHSQIPQQPMLPYYMPPYYMTMYPQYPQFPMGQYGAPPPYSAPPKYTGPYQQAKSPNQSGFHSHLHVSYPPNTPAQSSSYPYDQGMEPGFNAMGVEDYPAQTPFYASDARMYSATQGQADFPYPSMGQGFNTRPS